jgi:SAM-dependent methyltransferase
MSEFTCRLCGSKDLYLFYRDGAEKNYRYYRCRQCKLVNYNLSDGLDQTQYSSVYISPKDETHKFNRDQTQSYAYLKRYTDGPGKILDIGCFNARILYLAKQDGWEVKGIDLSIDIAEKVKQEVDIDIEVIDFYQYPEDDHDVYDVVILRHVLEHLPDSIGALQKIKSLMKEGGLGLLELPNIDGLSKKYRRFLKRVGLHRYKDPPQQPPGHCNEFCKESFSYLLRFTGFELVDWHTYSSKPLSDWLYRKIPIGNKFRALIRKSG